MYDYIFSENEFGLRQIPSIDLPYFFAISENPI